MESGEWEDAWIPGDGSLGVPTPMGNYDGNMCVNELIDFELGCWRPDVVAATFNEEEQKEVLEIMLPRSWPKDMRYWWPTSDGLYTVWSGYWLGRIGHLRKLGSFSMVQMRTSYGDYSMETRHAS